MADVESIWRVGACNFVLISSFAMWNELRNWCFNKHNRSNFLHILKHSWYTVSSMFTKYPYSHVTVIVQQKLFQIQSVFNSFFKNGHFILKFQHSNSLKWVFSAKTHNLWSKSIIKSAYLNKFGSFFVKSKDFEIEIGVI